MRTIRIVLLGLLYEKPLHGYEIKHIIEDHMDDWTDIKVGSIYFSLNKLSDEGNIEILDELREGNRPAKTIYQITDEGRKEFLRLLTKLWMSEDNTIYTMDVGIYFLTHLDKETLAGMLDKRIENMTRSKEYLESHIQEQKENKFIPAHAFAIMDHTYRHMNAEYDWLKSLQENLDSYFK